jgi:hypothetical protein
LLTIIAKRDEKEYNDQYAYHNQEGRKQPQAQEMQDEDHQDQDHDD